MQEVSARAEQTVKELRRKADHMRRQHAAEMAAAERRVWEARSKKVRRFAASAGVSPVVSCLQNLKDSQNRF
jgi:hypothetical protein